MGLPQDPEQGVTDMVRISDARMSVPLLVVVLHIPESSVGGPLPCEKWRWIELDANEGTSSRHIRRRVGATAGDLEGRKSVQRGYYKLYIDSVFG